jgi:hypothetical protein
MHDQTEKPLSESRIAIRVILGINFTLLVLFVIPLTHHWADRGLGALRSYNLEKPVGRSLQVWLPGSTLLATCLLGFTLWRKRKVPVSGLGIEVIMVVAWWLIVLGACVYAFMLGMGG